MLSALPGDLPPLQASLAASWRPHGNTLTALRRPRALASVGVLSGGPGRAAPQEPIHSSAFIRVRLRIRRPFSSKLSHAKKKGRQTGIRRPFLPLICRRLLACTTPIRHGTYLRRCPPTSQVQRRFRESRWAALFSVIPFAAWTIPCTPHLRNLPLPASRMSNASARAVA